MHPLSALTQLRTWPIEQVKNMRDAPDQLPHFNIRVPDPIIRVPDLRYPGLEPLRQPNTLPDADLGYRCPLYEGDTITSEITDPSLVGCEDFRLSVVREDKIEAWIHSMTRSLLETIGDDHSDIDIIEGDFDPIHKTAQVTIPFTKGFTLDGPYHIYIWNDTSGDVCRPEQRKITISPAQGRERFKRRIQDWAQEWGTLTLIGIGLLTLALLVWQLMHT